MRATLEQFHQPGHGVDVAAGGAVLIQYRAVGGEEIAVDQVVVDQADPTVEEQVPGHLSQLAGGHGRGGGAVDMVEDGCLDPQQGVAGVGGQVGTLGHQVRVEALVLRQARGVGLDQAPQALGGRSPSVRQGREQIRVGLEVEVGVCGELGPQGVPVVVEIDGVRLLLAPELLANAAMGGERERPWQESPERATAHRAAFHLLDGLFPAP